jgi:predicted XRE-type DNA-binding protein
MRETVTKSSRNVFIDLGYSPDEAAILQMRADLMADLWKFIKGKRLTQAKVGVGSGLAIIACPVKGSAF